MKTINHRKTKYSIDDIFLKRWSPRAMNGKKITNEQLMTLFEAARWAPSSMNEQPWRFVYAKKETKYFENFLKLLFEGNRVWCKNAAVLIVVISKINFSYNNKFSPTHSFDTGSAWENLALQGTKMGLVTHGMGGFDRKKAKEILNVPDDYNIEMMIAIGKPGNKNDLPEELKAREFPSDRKPLKEIIFEGKIRP